MITFLWFPIHQVSQGAVPLLTTFLICQGKNIYSYMLVRNYTALQDYLYLTCNGADLLIGQVLMPQYLHSRNVNDSQLQNMKDRISPTR